jgi:hypothetical protein
MENKLNIALVAHDARKQEMIEWVTYNIDALKEHNLYATGTTGSMISNIPPDSKYSSRQQKKAARKSGSFLLSANAEIRLQRS